ncbi:LacI family DNA-binding transcriptional regulator [Roseibium sp.]|uniref:LacI family DNA-binding transcriptional regulator n=1 Tax=Roseibium sp. TaxID=1936156 RepID=UPI003A971F9B
MTKRTTLKDIARETGVHVSTVSRALDPQKRSSLTDEVVRKIKSTADRLGYRPNRIAFSLRKQKTMTIGVMIPDITNMIFPAIVRGIESVMEPLGYASIIVNTDGDSAREKRLLETLQDRGVDGIIHTAVLRSDPTIVEAARQGLPVVTLNRKVEEADIPYVINDEESGIRKVFDLLYCSGHRKIAHLAGPRDLSTGLLRRQAFCAVARDYGFEENSLVVEEAQRFDEREGRRCAKAILERAPETTAILCANDRLGLGAIDQCNSIGRPCPESISITGFNDMALLDHIPPGLTTIRIEQFEAGATAARLLARILDGNGDSVPRETILPVSLTLRNSVGTVADAQL